MDQREPVDMGNRDDQPLTTEQNAEPNPNSKAQPEFYPLPELFVPTSKKREKLEKKRTKPGPQTTKNPMVWLNEIKPGLKYQMVEQKGPVHEPVFVFQVQVNGLTFQGQGRLVPKMISIEINQQTSLLAYK